MPFKSDNQRKAVMAKLNQGYVRSDVKPKVINAMPSTDNLIGLKNKAGFEIDERYSQLIKNDANLIFTSHIPTWLQVLHI